MRRSDSDGNTHLADVQFPCAVNHRDAEGISPFLRDFLRDFRHLLLRHRGVSLVFKAGNRSAVGIIPHGAEKHHDCAGIWALYRFANFRSGDDFGGYLKHRAPL